MKMRMFLLLGSILTVVSVAIGLCLLYLIELMLGPAVANNQAVFILATVVSVVIVAWIMTAWFKRSYRLARRKESPAQSRE